MVYGIHYATITTRNVFDLEALSVVASSYCANTITIQLDDSVRVSERYIRIWSILKGGELSSCCYHRRLSGSNAYLPARDTFRLSEFSLVTAVSSCCYKHLSTG